MRIDNETKLLVQLADQGIQRFLTTIYLPSRLHERRGAALAQQYQLLVLVQQHGCRDVEGGRQFLDSLGWGAYIGAMPRISGQGKSLKVGMYLAPPNRFGRVHGRFRTLFDVRGKGKRVACVSCRRVNKY